MTDERFWALIAESRHVIEQTHADGNMARQGAALHRTLAQLSDSDRRAFALRFYDHMRQAYRWDLWGACFLLNEGCSDDGFADFRSWLISMGREVYEGVLADPDSLAALVRDRSIEAFAFEELQAIAMSIIADEDVPPLPVEPIGRPWQRDQLPTLFPRLGAACGRPRT